MVVLIDSEAEIDTINLENNHVFIDTVYSDTLGLFVFNNVKEGLYKIYPVKENFLFNGINRDIINNVEISNKEKVQLEFEGYPLLQTGSDFYTIKIKVKNCTIRNHRYLCIKRKVWDLFIPHWDILQYSSINYQDNNKYQYEYEFGISKGYTLLFYTEENTFAISFHHHVGTVSDDNFVISSPIFDTPSVVEFEIDYGNKVVTRIR